MKSLNIVFTGANELELVAYRNGHGRRVIADIEHTVKIPEDAGDEGAAGILFSVIMWLYFI